MLEEHGPSDNETWLVTHGRLVIITIFYMEDTDENTFWYF